MNTVTVTKINESPGGAIFHVYLKSDGVAGELSNQTLIDPTVDFEPAMSAAPSMYVWRVWHELVGFNVLLAFDGGISKQAIWVMTPDTSNKAIFMHFGGLRDRNTNVGSTGKLQMTTSGFTAATRHGTFVIEVKKFGR